MYGQYIDYSEKKKWPKGFICLYTGTIFYNIHLYSRSQVSVYRTIGPLVFFILERHPPYGMGKHEREKKREYKNKVKRLKRKLKKQKPEKLHRCMCSSMSCPDAETSTTSSLRPQWTFSSVKEDTDKSDNTCDTDSNDSKPPFCPSSYNSETKNTSSYDKTRFPFKTDPLYARMMEYCLLKRRIAAIESASESK